MNIKYNTVFDFWSKGGNKDYVLIFVPVNNQFHLNLNILDIM